MEKNRETGDVRCETGKAGARGVRHFPSPPRIQKTEDDLKNRGVIVREKENHELSMWAG